MEIGGRQGSSLTGRMFSKLMDMISEELQESGEGIPLTNDFLLAVLLWVDDVVTFAEGVEHQQMILKRIDEFAIKHKLKWGPSKCNVMRVGHHSDSITEWKLGDVNISECQSYKYLGDYITNDGKNSVNLESRKNRLRATTIKINSIAETEVLQLIESYVLIEFHEKISISSLLTNCESWNLKKGEMDSLEKMEIQALKHLFDLPTHTPTPAVIFSLGTLYTRQRVHKRQLLYLHKILKKYDGQWTKRALEILEEKNLGWYKNIKKTLEEYGLPTDFGTIKTIPRRTWIRNVGCLIEQMNKKRLSDDCHKTTDGNTTPKTKTISIIEQIEDPYYQKGFQDELKQLFKHEFKTIIMARFRMLECGKNFKGTLQEMCNVCKCIDNENHRLNDCTKFRPTMKSHPPVNFDDIYSNDLTKIRSVINAIEMIWDTFNSHGKVRRNIKCTS